MRRLSAWCAVVGVLMLMLLQARFVKIGAPIDF
jgi:hypothetical protein